MENPAISERHAKSRLSRAKRIDQSQPAEVRGSRNRDYEAWLAEEKLPTAILAAYDYIAIGMMKVLKEHGIRVPEDIAVIGMDDIAVAPYLETSLSSIRTYTPEACKKW